MGLEDLRCSSFTYCSRPELWNDRPNFEMPSKFNFLHYSEHSNPFVVSFLLDRWGAFSEKANFGFFERVLWKGKFWPKFSQNLPLQPQFAFSQNHWNMPKNWNLCPFRHSINFLDESHCKGTEELIQKNNWSHKKFSYFITERVKDSSF